MIDRLREDLLYLVVFGPGYGESILVRPPGGSWLVVDGCRAQGAAPAAQLLRATARHWSCVVLTHPHLDHAAGLDEVLDCSGAGPVGCADPRVMEPEHWTRSPDAEEWLARGAVEHVLAAIHDRWMRQPEHRWLLRRGDVREVAGMRLRVLHPDEASIPFRDPNRMAAALLVEWENVRLLLGSDVVAVDWEAIAREASDLARHAALKVPHHGSRGAVHDVYAGPAEGAQERVWIVTPYNRGRRLPSFGNDEGLAWLLEREERVQLTGLPVPFERQASYPRTTTLAELQAGRVADSGWSILPAQPADPGCYVAVGFDRDGRLVDERRGPGSVAVHRAVEETGAGATEGGP